MKHWQKRAVEIFPGVLVYTTLIGAIVLSFIRPLWMVYFIMVFDLYWLLRILYFIPFLLASWSRYRKAIRRDWQADVERLPGYDKVRHLIFLPTYKEDANVIRDTLESLDACTYPSKRMVIVLAGEERDQENFRKISEELVPAFADHFAELLVTLHPKNLPNEIPGKGST